MSSLDISARKRANGAVIGLFVCLGFGTLWLVMALGFWPARPSWCLPGALAAGALLTLWTLLRAPLLRRLALADPRPVRAHTGALFALVVVLEVVAINAAVNVLIAFHHAELQTFAIAAVVGLHFLPLAWLFRVRIYYWAGVLMVAWTGACLTIQDRVNGAVALGLGMGAILWGVAILVLVRLKR